MKKKEGEGRQWNKEILKKRNFQTVALLCLPLLGFVHFQCTCKRINSGNISMQELTLPVRSCLSILLYVNDI